MIGTKCNKCTVSVMSKHTIGIKLLFFAVLELVIKRFDTNSANPELILAILPPAISSQLRSKGATTLQDLFKANSPLVKAFNWFELSLLTLLVENFGDQVCKQELKAYVIILTKYLQSRSQVVREDTVSDSTTTCQLSDPTSSKSPKIRVLVDPEWDEKLLKDEGDGGGYICSLLGTTTNRVQFTTSYQ